jgi:nitroreductase
MTLHKKEELMSDLLAIVKERRSVRHYLDKPIPPEILDQILAAVQWSPSWANTQCWELVVVQDPALKAELQETVGSTNPACRAVKEAPLLLALCGREHQAGYYKGVRSTKWGDWILFDLGIAAQSISLMAASLGLGSVIIGLMDHDRADKILKVPEGIKVVALIPLGYPSKIPAAPKRREIAAFVHQNRF